LISITAALLAAASAVIAWTLIESAGRRGKAKLRAA
jgi:hypothetical protein